MATPVYGTLVPLVGRINTAALAVGQVRWFIWSAYYQQLVEHGYADVYDPQDPGVVVALKVDGQAATYAALPTSGVPAGAVYVVQQNGKAYVYSGTGWPSIGSGISITGPTGDTGVGVADIAVVGTSLAFDMTDGIRRFVSVPAMVDVKTWRDEAAVYAADMNSTVMPQIAADRAATVSARSEAVSARDAAVTAAGTATGAASTATGARDTALTYRNTAQTHATNAGTARDQSVAAKGIAETARDQAQSARDTAVNTLAAVNSALADYDVTLAGHVSDSEAARDAALGYRNQAQTIVDGVAAGVVPDNGVSTGKLQDGAVTKAKLASAVQASLGKADTALQSVAYGAAAGTACQGDDSRLSNQRTPVDGSVTAAKMTAAVKTDTLNFRQTPAGTARVAGPGAEFFMFTYPCTIVDVRYRMGTPDGSGTTTVCLRTNGGPAQLSGTASTSPSKVTGTLVMGDGDILTVDTTALGGTPGKGLVAIITAVRT